MSDKTTATARGPPPCRSEAVDIGRGGKGGGVANECDLGVRCNI